MMRFLALMASLGVSLSAGEMITHSVFSYMNTKGNTDITSLSFEASAKKGWELHEWRGHVDTYRSSDSGKLSSNKWSSEFNYDYRFCPRVSLNFLAGYKDDSFSGFDYQLYGGPGVGVKLIDNPVHKLDLQGNVLYAEDKAENKRKDDYFSSKAGIIYHYKVLENLKFIQEATYRINLEERDYQFAYSKTAIENKITPTFSLAVSYKIDYVKTPPPPSLNTDRSFLVGLVIDY